ncbi:SIR2 family protein [Plantibacter flavus]|uniref:SIR2 family protein n=1 Tax=Plantibacter flavus TaxID=150123 RepID=UPI00237984A1|nr:SIR2 family protein [Plantibacter flavus]MDD9153985.1 SIR2 family protein [Plantibacter flavus]
MTDRTAVLLGAGASRDAGLPLTEELARKLVESFDDELAQMPTYDRASQERIVRALHVVYAAMLAHATEQGMSPLSAVNVERLVSAIRLLRDRRTHEAAPFVSTWRASIESVDSHPLPVTDSDIREHLTMDSDFRLQVDGLAEKIASIAQATFAAGDGTTFRQLEEQVLRRIAILLSEPEDVSYLAPLMELALSQEGGLDVTTLNYDRTVEEAAQAAGVEVDTGLDRWTPGLPITFPSVDGRINLIKPHGSIDWERRGSSSRERLDGYPLVRHVYRTNVAPELHAGWGVKSSPLIVIGDREKLETDGPTLALLRAFEDSLHRSSNLLVVGYSFADEHVNTVIRNWMNADPQRTVAILDPGWSNPRMIISPDTELSFKEALVYTAGLSLQVVPGRIVVVKKGARQGLAEAIAARPLAKLETHLEVTVDPSQPGTISITNPGYALTSVVVRAWPEWKRNPMKPTAALRDELAGPWVDSLELPDLEPGATHTFSYDAAADPSPVSIEVKAESWAYQVRERISVSDGTESPS